MVRIAIRERFTITRSRNAASYHRMPVLYLARFDPPLQSRLHPHLGRRVLIGWILAVEKPLALSGPFRIWKREAQQRELHTVNISMCHGTSTWSYDCKALADSFHQRLIAWIAGQNTMAQRQGFSPAGQALLQEPHCLRFLPAFVTLPGDGQTLGCDGQSLMNASYKNCEPSCLEPDPSDPVDWAGLRILLAEEPCIEALHRSFAEANTSGTALRALCKEAVAARKETLVGARQTTSTSSSQSSELTELTARAALLDEKADALARRVRAPLLGRVVVTNYNSCEYLITDIDPIRSIASHMPRRSKREQVQRAGRGC